jgi:hypothetical protein
VRCASAARLSEVASCGRGYRILLACLTRYDLLAACDPCVLMRVPSTCCADRMVIHRHCIVAFSCRVESARPPALGNEVSSTMDLAMGSAFRGTYGLYPTRLFFSCFFFCYQIVAVSIMILCAYPLSLFSFFRFSDT